MTREEALNEIRSWAIPSEKGREVLETLIPELAESEDERTRKSIIRILQVGSYMSPEEKNKAIAYLEKQKENPDRVNLIGKAKSEKQVVLLTESNGNENIYWDTKSEEDAVSLLEKGLKFFGKQKPAEWSEEDERMLRTIISDGSRGVELDSKQISWLKSLRPSWKSCEGQKKAL